MICPATADDLDALVVLEAHAFTHDRLSRRSFRHLLTRGNAAALIDREAEGLCGYAVVLFRRGSAHARLYSIAVDPEYRGRGKGVALLAAAEQAGRERGCADLRLEVHPENRQARELYARAGYREFGIYPEFYEDGADAIRMEKTLNPALETLSVPAGAGHRNWH